MPSPPTVTRRLRIIDGLLRQLASRPSPVEAEVAALDHVVVDGAVCCDIGAGFGLYTLTCARRVGPTGRVLAFEPLPGPRRALTRAVRWLHATNVTVFPEAVGAAPRTVAMSLPVRRGLPVHGRAFVADDADGLGSNAEFRRARRVAVEVVTLDDMVDRSRLERLDLIKIDVEGYEPTVLRGAERTIRRFRPVMLLEIEDRHLRRFGVDSASVVAMMHGYGYDMATLVDGRFEP